MHMAMPTRIAGMANKIVVTRQPHRPIMIAAHSGMNAVPTLPAVKWVARATPRRFLFEMVRYQRAADRVLGGAAHPRHDRPEEKLKVALREADQNEAEADGSVADAEYMVPWQDPAEGAGGQLERAAHGAGHAEHDAELAVAEVQLAQNQGKHQGFKRRLSVVDTVRQAHQG
jgi:hypothetical protein